MAVAIRAPVIFITRIASARNLSRPANVRLNHDGVKPRGVCLKGVDSLDIDFKQRIDSDRSNRIATIWLVLGKRMMSSELIDNTTLASCSYANHYADFRIIVITAWDLQVTSSLPADTQLRYSVCRCRSPSLRRSSRVIASRECMITVVTRRSIYREAPRNR